MDQPTTAHTTAFHFTRQPLPAMPSSYKSPQHTQPTQALKWSWLWIIAFFIASPACVQACGLTWSKQVWHGELVPRPHDENLFCLYLINTTMVHCSAQLSVGYHAGAHLSFMRIQSSHQLIKPHSNPLCLGEKCFGIPPKPYMWPDSWSQQVSMHHLMEIQMNIHPSTATSYSWTGGLGGQNTSTSLISCLQLLATAKNLLQCVAMLLLGGAELRMRISLAPHVRPDLVPRPPESDLSTKLCTALISK